MEKAFRQAHLHPFRFNTIIQQGEKIGNRLIGPVRRSSKSKPLLLKRLLRGLIDKITHILFEKPNDMAGEDYGRFHNRIIKVPLRMSKITRFQRSMLTSPRTLLYDDLRTRQVSDLAKP